MENAGNYICIQSWMVTELKLKANELIIYALIHGFCQDGISFFYGSIKYIMENTNLSKETVLSVLQSLVRKKLIVKKDVKSYQVFDNKKTASGSQHFCLYYTVYSRKKKKEPSGQESVPEHEEKTGSRNLTGSESLTRAGQEFVPGSGQEFVPNNLSDNKADNTTSSDKKTFKKQAEVEENFDKLIYKKLNELFGYQVNFSPSPIPGFKKSITTLEFSQEEALEYLSWVFDYLKSKCKEKENLDGYFYKSFSEPNLMAKFKNDLAQKKAAEEEKARLMITCPVCGFKHTKTDPFCPQCRLDADYITDKKNIEKQKKIYFMSPAARKTYENALLKLEEEYPLTKRFCNIQLQKEYEHEISIIEHTFGLYEDEST